MAASWDDFSSCRIYMLHKECQFTELSLDSSPITSLDFDQYGGFLLISSADKVAVTCYKKWKKIITQKSIQTQENDAIVGAK